MPEVGTYRDALRDIALDNFGYVTTGDAVGAGVPAGELPKLAARGGLDHVGYGLYRVRDIPPSRVDQYAEAVLRGGVGAHLRGESVLALLDLGDVLPRRIEVAVPRRARPAVPPFMTLTRVPGGGPVTRYEGVASQPVSEAIRTCRGRIPVERLLQVAKQARDAGLLTAAEWRSLGRELRS